MARYLPLRATAACGLAWLSIFGCLTADETPGPPRVANGFGPDPIQQLGASVAPFVQRLSRRSAVSAVALEHGVLAADELGLWRVESSTVSHLGNSPGGLVGAAQVEDTVLVAGLRGFFVLDGSDLQESPLSRALPVVPLGLLRVVRDGQEEVWISSEGALHIWQDGQLRRVLQGSLSLTGPRLAWSPQGEMWVAAGPDLYAVVPSKVWRARPELDRGPVASLAVPSSGTLWIVDSSGRVSERSQDGHWVEHTALSGARTLAAHPDAGTVWIEFKLGIVRVQGRDAQLVSGTEGAKLLAADPRGDALVSTADGLLRLYGKLEVELIGLAEGSRLSETVMVVVRPPNPDQVLEVSATLNGSSLSVDERWQMRVEVENLTEGAQQLRVVVRYQNGPEVETTRNFTFFRGAPPSWDMDIRPIAERHCKLCHGEQGSASTRLATAADWQRGIDSILTNVRANRMPLPPSPPLRSVDIERIEAWRAAGFPLNGE